jgi:hypothetical protein
MDTTTPLNDLLLQNDGKYYQLQQRQIIFLGDGEWKNTRSLILKEGIRNGVIEVFVFFFIYLVVSLFACVVLLIFISFFGNCCSLFIF